MDLCIDTQRYVLYMHEVNIHIHIYIYTFNFGVICTHATWATCTYSLVKSESWPVFIWHSWRDSVKHCYVEQSGNEPRIIMVRALVFLSHFAKPRTLLLLLLLLCTCTTLYSTSWVLWHSGINFQPLQSLNSASFIKLHLEHAFSAL